MAGEEAEEAEAAEAVEEAEEVHLTHEGQGLKVQEWNTANRKMSLRRGSQVVRK